MDSFPASAALRDLLASCLKFSGAPSVVDMDGTRRLAHGLGLTEGQAMRVLLARGIWPERFLRSRESVSEETLLRLLSSRVLIAGCGGLGGHLAALLARSGIGCLVLCDPDIFEESNLNRQRFCTEKTLGHPKVEACRDGLREMASYLEVQALPWELDEDNLPGLLKGTDAVADCLDSLDKKKMLERAARNAGVPYLHGAVARHEGFACLDREGSMMSRLYAAPETTGGNMNTTGLTVAATACVMAALLVRSLGREADNRDRLFHIDVSLPELESFSLS